MPQDEGTPAGDLQFDHAELKSEDAKRPACKVCNLEIGDTYYTINTHMVCPRCKDKFQEKLEGGSPAGRFLLAALFGFGAAILGAVIWYAVVKITNYQLSIIAIVVGVLVGTAVKKGSKGRGGWAYQSLAVLLTYFAIGITNVPLILDAMNEHHAEVKQTAPANATQQKATEANAAPTRSSNSHKAFGLRDLGLGLIAIIVLAFISPFLGRFENIIGILIIGIGLYQAWKINKKRILAIAGPFQISVGALR